MSFFCSFFHSLRTQLLVPLYPAMRNYVYAFLAFSAIMALVVPSVGCWFVPLAVAIYYFYRDPQRSVPQGAGFVVAHADGIIDRIEHGVLLPEEIRTTLPEDVQQQSFVRISIYMSLLDNHIQRAPVAGVVEREIFVKGVYSNAQQIEAAQRNERSLMALKTQEGEYIICSQIAGAISRVVVCQAFEGDALERGARYGIIRFGCRAELFIPMDYALLVSEGTNVRAGETMMAIHADSCNMGALTWKIV